jgi:hypothetical protein
MSMRVRFRPRQMVLMIAVVGLSAAGCGTDTQRGVVLDPSSPLAVERGAPLGQQQSTPAPGEVKLWVSNQSFDDDPVRLTVSIGETRIIGDDFDVEGQHNWIAFDIHGLEPGVHTISAESDTGARFAGEFTVPGDEPRWLVLDYWYYSNDPSGRRFSFRESDHAVAFA